MDEFEFDIGDIVRHKVVFGTFLVLARGKIESKVDGMRVFEKIYTVRGMDGKLWNFPEFEFINKEVNERCVK